MINYIRENRKDLRDIFKFQISYIVNDLDYNLDTYYDDLERHGYATPFDDASVKELLDIVSDIKDYTHTDVQCNFSFNDSEGKQMGELCRFIFEVFKPYFVERIESLKKPYVLFEIDEFVESSDIALLVEASNDYIGFDTLEEYNRYINEYKDDSMNYILTSK